MFPLPSAALSRGELGVLAIADDALNGSTMGGGIPMGELDRCPVILFDFGSDDCWFGGFLDFIPGIILE